MEENYKPDGWLGIILGSKLYMNFKEGTHKGIQELLKEIKNVRAGMCKLKFSDNLLVYLSV